jgi:hypothetical protein
MYLLLVKMIYDSNMFEPNKGVIIPEFVGQIRLKPLDFSGEKILRMSSFGGEVKPSVPCCSFAACKKSLMISVEVVIIRPNLFGHFSPIIPPFTNRVLSCLLMWSASGDDGGN